MTARDVRALVRPRPWRRALDRARRYDRRREIEPRSRCELRDALARAREELARCAKSCTARSAREVGEFIDAHSLMLDDRELTAGLVELIRRRPLPRQRRAEDAARSPGRRVRRDGRSVPAQPQAKTSIT